MIIRKINPSVDYNQWLKLLEIQLNEQTNQNFKIVPKFVKLTLFYDFWGQCDKQPNFPFRPVDRQIDINHIDRQIEIDKSQLSQLALCSNQKQESIYKSDAALKPDKIYMGKN